MDSESACQYYGYSAEVMATHVCIFQATKTLIN